jgi:hypothetical protein
MLLGTVTRNLTHCEGKIEMRMRGERPGYGAQFADRGPPANEAELLICLLPDVPGVSRWLFQCPANWDIEIGSEDSQREISQLITIRNRGRDLIRDLDLNCR